MEEAEEEAVRKRKLAEKQKEAEAKEVESKLKEALRSALSEAAYDRLSNVALANKELYLGCAQQMLLAHRKLGRRISEEELISVLRALKARMDKEVSITFHKK